MYGVVQDSDGNPLPGANVIAEHTPSGTQYGASTRENGLFNLPNLRIGDRILNSIICRIQPRISRKHPINSWSKF